MTLRPEFSKDKIDAVVAHAAKESQGEQNEDHLRWWIQPPQVRPQALHKDTIWTDEASSMKFLSSMWTLSTTCGDIIL